MTENSPAKIGSAADDKAKASLKLSGSCFCGKVVIHVTGLPSSCSICHCSICRSLTGSAFSIQSLHKASDFTCSVPESELWGITTSKMVRRYRCPECGSPAFASIRDGKNYAVPRSVLYQSKDPKQLDAIKKHFSPSHHMYYGDRSMDVPDELPKYVGTSFPGRAVLWTEESKDPSLKS